MVTKAHTTLKDLLYNIVLFRSKDEKDMDALRQFNFFI